MAVIRGTQRDDILVGTLFNDSIFGLGGNDRILADPTVFDFVGGDDFVDGGSGNDEIFTFGGDDEVISGSGNDTVRTADGDDRIEAGLGNDDVQSGRDEDTVLGQAGDDELRGGEDDDDLRGGAGNDRVIGGSDDDALRDGNGVDQLEGRTGDDAVILGADLFTDTVVFMADDVGNGVDTISGFNTAAPDAGGDLIDIQEVAGDGFELAEDSGDVLVLAGPAEEEVLLARVEGVGDEAALADNILDGDGAGAALVAEAGDDDLIPLGPESEPVSGFADVLGDDGPTEGAGAISFAQVLDDGADLIPLGPESEAVVGLADVLGDDGPTEADEAQVLDDGAALVSGGAEPAVAAITALGEASVAETGPSLDQLLATPDAVV